MPDTNSFNKIVLIGHLGRDPEVRYTPKSNTPVANISLATSEIFFKSDGERDRKTQWHSIEAWGKKAEFAENYLKKGMQIIVEGKLRYNTWTDKNGSKRKTAKIRADQIVLMGKKGSGDVGEEPDQDDSDIDNGFNEEGDGLPF